MGFFRGFQSRIPILGIRNRDFLFLAGSKNSENSEFPGIEIYFFGISAFFLIFEFFGIRDLFVSRDFYPQDFWQIPRINAKFPGFEIF